MRIVLDTCEGNEEILIDQHEGSITIPSNRRLRFKFTDKHSGGIVIRHPGELVLHDGWICLGYDREGYLVELEIHEGDPYKNANTENMSYLQPRSPLGNVND
jgi:hypothetical protein